MLDIYLLRRRIMDIQVIANPNGAHINRIRQVVDLVNGAQRSFKLKLGSINQPLSNVDSLIDPEKTCQLVETEISDGYFICITEQLFDDNWFSHEYRRSAIITIGDWETLYAPPSLKAYLMYQIAQALLHFSADLSEEMAMRMVHEPPKGCMMDLSVNKPTIKLGMVSGNLCPSCASQLRQLGISDEALNSIERILLRVRSEATGRPITFDSFSAFVVMRFTQHDENDNAWKYGIETGLKRCGIKAVRADNRVESGQILNKILTNINRSRFVVVKVDENNLNVYFELGLAMGLDKEVLLISESSLVINLPTDLKNWECLTYERGNYSQLSDRVALFYNQNYGLEIQ
ncbi:MAG: hypothetical protein AUG51_09530 [Acidobacteria bacterium 13_1_20CM_3_53_8]|nr:MAG: hypothetical protein AUG51_09530 [Acidobacteria bacterium 13_1_20CM_3_53_8]